METFVYPRFCMAPNKETNPRLRETILLLLKGEVFLYFGLFRILPRLESNRQ